MSAPTGRWLLAGTDLADPYPCMCNGTHACSQRCPCRGRTDNLDKMPTTCCGRRAAETTQRTRTVRATTEPSNRGQKEEE